MNNHHFLIDCGEGAQRMMSRMKVPKHKITHIFISHLHGDHFLGLPGLINSMSLGGRQHPLTVYSPPGLKQILEEIQKWSMAEVAFPIHYVELVGSGQKRQLELENVLVDSFLLQHRIPCYGYVFREKKWKYSLSVDRLNDADVPSEWRSRIAQGEDYVSAEGRRLPFDFFVKHKKKPRSYAYCTDTLFDVDHVQYFQGVDLLYHEATFEHALLDKAIFSMHTTALQAGELARDAEVGALLIGHYSNRYRSTDRLCQEARSIFRNSWASEDGMRAEIRHEAGEIKMLISS